MNDRMDLKQKIFDLIYEEPDLDKGINEALACVGREFGISRVYIFENNDANTHSSNTFEWCAPGIEPQIDELQNMSFEEYDYQSMFDESGLFFGPDVSQLPEMIKELMESQGIRATLQYAVYDKGIFRGFVGFDDCCSARPEWRDDGVSLTTLIYISRLLSVCLLKERNLQRAQRLHSELKDSLAAEKKMREAATKAADAKTNFLSRMSHDMRTPMNGILGLAVLSEDETDPDVLKQNMLKIRNSGEYLLGLINDILDSQKIETGKLQLNAHVVDGTSFIEDMLDMVRRFADDKDIEFETQINHNEMAGYIRIDPIRAKQICINLLSNAIKFTPDHGHVYFGIKGSDVLPGTRHVTITVKDDGVGMSRKFLQDGIYKSFSQEYNALSYQNVSTGLGLAIVKQLVDMMGGKIEVESELGKGTEFTVSLDVEHVHEVAAARVASDDMQSRENMRAILDGKRILLAEDHPLNAEVAHRLLEKMGCEVTWAENGRIAVDMFEAAPVNGFDAVLLDIRMPVMDGLQAARAIRALNRPDASTVPVIAMTANAYEEDTRASLAAGMNDHLAKPIEPRRMYEALAMQIQIAADQRMEVYSFMMDTAAEHISEINMNTVHELVKGAVAPRGAYVVEYEAFSHIHEFLARNATRLQHGTQIVLFTTDESGDDSTYRELADAVQRSLRAGDLVMEFNERQIVVLLVNCDNENREKVVSRVMNALQYKTKLSQGAVHYEISSI